MKTRMSLWLAVIVAIAVLAGCGQANYKPSAINEETDKCATCNMQVKDDAFAVQLFTTDGKNYKFDDLGCMNKWKQDNTSEKIGAEYVRDYNNKEWVDYEDAFYVYDASFKTPMAYGIYSFKDKKSAQAFVDEHKTGTLMSSADLQSHDWKQHKEMKHDMGAGHEGQSHSSTH